MLRNLPFRIALASALALNLAASPAILSAQQIPAEIPDITIRTSTRLVVVDVVVRDKKGQPVTGLKPEDFTVEENGKKQKIATFTPPGTNQGSAKTLPPGILSNRPEFLKPAGGSDRASAGLNELGVPGSVLWQRADVEICPGAKPRG